MCWVLERGYGLPREEVDDDLMTEVSLKNKSILEISEKRFLKMMTEYKSSKIYFVDHSLVALAKHKRILVASFDRDMEKLGANVYKLE